jgi:phage shock protein A
MSKFNIEEVKAMSPEEQVVELDKQIQSVKDTRDQNTANIRHLEEVNENLNQQLETLIELKWNCKFQQRLHEWMGDMDDVVNPDNKTK